MHSQELCQQFPSEPLHCWFLLQGLWMALKRQEAPNLLCLHPLQVGHSWERRRDIGERSVSGIHVQIRSGMYMGSCPDPNEVAG